MREEVERALQRAVAFRRTVLKEIAYERRLELLEELLRDFFVQQRASLLKWSALTGQSAQVDTGSIAQHVASLVLTEPGQGFKGKGLDLADGSEVKSAAILSGVDRPRWNHNLGTVAIDKARAARSQPAVSQAYLEAASLFYFLFDRVVSEVTGDADVVLRVRAWCVDPAGDEAWRDLLHRFLNGRNETQYNLQLHPPVGYDDSIVVNTLGNLDMADVKVLETRMRGWQVGEEFEIAWVQKPPESVRPINGRSRALPYEGRQARPSRLNAAEDVEPDVDSLRVLLPTVDISKLREAVAADAKALESSPADDEESGE